MGNPRTKGRTVAKHGPHPVDVHVGGRVRMRRMMLGMTQTDLDKVLDLTFQQVQKNECGFNCIGASRLYALSHILGVPVANFFEGLDGETPARRADDAMLRPETLKLVKAYYRISDPEVRETLGRMTKAMAKGVAEGGKRP
jgi:transcriptional regulator with XRE-family HTH domain